MKFFVAVLLLLTTAAYAEHAGRGLARHSQVGIDQPYAPPAEIVELPRAVVHTAAQATEARPKFTITATVEPATSVKYELFSAVEPAPKISDAFAEPPTAGELILNPEVVALVEKLTARTEAKKLKAVETEKLEAKPVAEAGPTAEQLEIMRRDHLSIPPTLYNSDGSVRAAGRTSKGAAITAPTVYYQNDYCPECQRKQRR